MKNFFAFPTVNDWEENVFQLTTAGIVTIVVLIVALIAIALLVRPNKEKGKISVKQLVVSGVALALATVTSMIKFLDLPMGGSITLCSMLFIALIGYWYGPKVGITTAIAYGLLQFVIQPVFYSIPQLIVDYPLAFGALGLSGFFTNSKNGLVKGYILGVLGRYLFAFLSGLLFFAAYAEGTGMGPVVYSLAYNGSYLGVEAVITLIVLAIPAVRKAFGYIKTTVVE